MKSFGYSRHFKVVIFCIIFLCSPSQMRKNSVEKVRLMITTADSLSNLAAGALRDSLFCTGVTGRT
jgi:hypothetical protein